jgi:hypothetical protein
VHVTMLKVEVLRFSQNIGNKLPVNTVLYQKTVVFNRKCYEDVRSFIHYTCYLFFHTGLDGLVHGAVRIGGSFS